MQIHELLINRKNEALAQIETLRQEVAEIERMLVTANVPQLVSAGDVPVALDQHDTTAIRSKDDAIIAAIRAGNNTPAKISEFIQSKLGLEVNQGSTRTRLSRMKADGKIKHDGLGWKL